jgi:hypothetical protein
MSLVIASAIKTKALVGFRHRAGKLPLFGKRIKLEWREIRLERVLSLARVPPSPIDHSRNGPAMDKIKVLRVDFGPHAGQWVVVEGDDVLGYFPTAEEAETWVQEGEEFERPLPPPLPESRKKLIQLLELRLDHTEKEKPYDYAGYLNRHLTKKDDDTPLPAVTEKKGHPKRADFESYGAYAAAVYDQYGTAGSMGAVEVVGAYRRQLSPSFTKSWQ